MIDVAELVADLTARLESDDDTELDEAVAATVLLVLDLACQVDELSERVAALEGTGRGEPGRSDSGGVHS